MVPDEIKSLASLTRLNGHGPPAVRNKQPDLRSRRMHELTGPGSDFFAIVSAAQHARDVIWIALRRDLETLCPSGLQAYLDPDRVTLVEAVSRGEALWAADQALRAEGGFCVILDSADALSLKESRRLQLAAEQGGGLGLILLRGPADSSAAQTRWDCRPVLADQPSWAWDCVKGKNGEAGTWHIAHDGEQNATDTLHMALAAAP
ncbi:MAG: hypothetical protein ACE37M_16795 [Henriciella sp.]